jgi:hypothetical protein
MFDVEVPRMRAGGPFLTPPAFRYFFKDSITEIKYKYSRTRIVPREVIQRERMVSNKAKRTATYVSQYGEGEPEPIVFDLASKGYKLPEPVVDSGSDLEDNDDMDVDETGDIDVEVSKMWRQFLVDMALKTPNRAGAANASYFKLSGDERLSVGEDVYKNPNLSETWRACQYKVGSREEWERAFGHLFPAREQRTAQTVQNYTQCKYFLQWKKLCAEGEAVVVDAIRKQLWQRVWQFAWIPHACQDKMWPTTSLARFTRLPPDTRGPAPRMLVKSRPRW